MKYRHLALPLVVLLALLSIRAAAGDTPDAAAGSQPWTLEEALRQLRLQPHDPYLQYVALQLARREQKAGEAFRGIPELFGNEAWEARRGRRGAVDLFGIFTGALAVQESLQLDTMRGEQPIRRAPARIGRRGPWVVVEAISKLAYPRVIEAAVSEHTRIVCCTWAFGNNLRHAAV
jgi:hypothetical protein